MNKPSCFTTKTGAKWYQYDISNFSDAEFARWYALVSNEKRRRVNCFQFREDKVRAVAGDMLAKTAVAEWCNTAAENVHFSADQYGKPFAVGLSVEFNISHSGNMVVCAVSDKPIGIDVEKIRNIDICVIDQICTADEKAYIMQSMDPPTSATFSSVLVRFFEVWTAKEAFLKCIGTGITNLRYIDVLHYLRHGYCNIMDNYVISVFQFDDSFDVHKMICFPSSRVWEIEPKT